LANHLRFLGEGGQVLPLEDDPYEVAYGDVFTVVGFVWFFEVAEVEWVGSFMIVDCGGRFQFFREGYEVVVGSSFVGHVVLMCGWMGGGVVCIFIW